MAEFPITPETVVYPIPDSIGDLSFPVIGNPASASGLKLKFMPEDKEPFDPIDRD